MRYQEKVLSIVFKVKSARFRRQDHGFRQSDHGFRSQDHRFRRTVKIGRFKSETMIELNRKVRSAYIGIDDRFGSEYAFVYCCCIGFHPGSNALKVNESTLTDLLSSHNRLIPIAGLQPDDILLYSDWAGAPGCRLQAAFAAYPCRARRRYFTSA
ncbi:hypothetical protein SERMPA_00080 (plasmid) [Serratia marcescens]